IPNFKPYSLQASAISRTISPLPFFHGAFFTEYSVYFEGHRQKPQWCFAVMIIPFIPASLQIRAHWRQSDSVGLNNFTSSFPKPQDWSVYVFKEKWIKA